VEEEDGEEANARSMERRMERRRPVQVGEEAARVLGPTTADRRRGGG
jgi:hypothetical protein